MKMTKELEPHAELIVMRGKKQGHDLGSWYAANVVLEGPPPPGIVPAEGSKLMIACADCGAWAALLNDEGVSVNSTGFDEPCTGQEGPAAA